MSILLDALKRSESQRELGSIPTLKTAVESPSRVESQAPGWLPVLLILTAAGLICWMGLTQFSLPEDGAETRLAVQGEEEPPGEPGSTSANPEPNQVSSASHSILPQLPESGAENPQQIPGPDAQPEQRGLGHEVRDYAAGESPAVTTEPTTELAAEPQHENAVRQPEVAHVEVARVEQAGEEQAGEEQVGEDRAGEKQGTAQPEQGQSQEPYEPEIINYWQVPEKMREGLPDLRISVLVYAELPENRFVLVNGERLLEGQETADGLLLEEIRRDRAIFNYRNYRFYLKS